MMTPPLYRPPLRRSIGVVLAICLACGSGCASFSNPVGDGIPARRIPKEYLAEPREELKTIPLPTLSQIPPAAYKVDKGDTLGVFIEGVLGEKGQPLPVQPRDPLSGGNYPPAIGYPIPVSADGTLPLPYIPPLKVDGLTLRQIEELVRKEYIERGILNKGQERILISLVRPRQVRVQVLRQETPQTPTGAGGVYSAKRGTGQIVDLPAYENDVLSALTRSGGLPGLDSINEVIIERGLSDGSTKILRIPMRARPGTKLPFDPEDVKLENGDVLFIEARDTEVYYVGGLTQPRQYILPRDYDVRVTEAVAIAGGPLVNGGVNSNNLSGSLIAAGLGSPSPSSATILRRTKYGGQIKINVNLNRALNNPSENLIMQAGDMLIVQETLGESFTRYMTNQIRINPLATIIRQRDLVTTVSGNFP